VHVNFGDRSTRNKLLALAIVHGELHAGAGVRCLAPDLPGRQIVRL